MIDPSAYRPAASECLRGGKRRDTLASLDKSIKQLEDSMNRIASDIGMKMRG
jgi:hypothetical protein